MFIPYNVVYEIDVGEQDLTWTINSDAESII